MSDGEKLDQIRDRIDALDAQIQELISERAAMAPEVARVKLADDPERGVRMVEPKHPKGND